MFEVYDELTVENILKRIDEYSIFKAYCPNFKELDKKFIAELHRTNKEDIPSAVITAYGGKLWYKDFGNSDKAMDCFKYVQEKYGMGFIQALGTINLDFNLGLQPIEIYRPSLNYVGLPDAKLKISMRSEFTIIEPTHRRWSKEDVHYWRDRFKIEKETLMLYEVRPVKWYLINGKFVNPEPLTYSYFIDKDKTRKFYKIYSPNSKQFKWITNCKSHHYQGYNQLPLSGDLLIITKSLKDVMELYQMGYSSIAPGSEAHQIDDDFMRLLHKRFGKVIVFFDNDEAGMRGAGKITYHHGIDSIMIPLNYDVKDISDFTQKYGKSESQQLMKKLLNE